MKAVGPVGTRPEKQPINYGEGDYSMDRMAAIRRLAEEQEALIAAHTYQTPEIQDAADIVGDSYALAKKAADSQARSVYMCGVRFMAEGVKILAPDKRVVLVEPQADCPMARQIDPQRVAEFRDAHPEYAVVAYINTTAELKAVSDVCVTSSSALKIVRALPQKDILFIPDKNLGDYVRRQVPEKHIVTWDGYCPVHNAVTAADVQAARRLYPAARVAMHPECPPEALALADMTGSTAAIIEYIRGGGDDVIVATERGGGDRLEPAYPGRLHQLCGEKLICPDMKRTTLESLLAAMEGRGGEEIRLEEGLAAAARHSLENMLRYGG